MYKITLIVLLLLLSIANAYSQPASSYFPSSTGYKWYFKNTPLDSLNNPQPDAATYQIDSFGVVQNYQGLSASFVFSKSGLLNINQNTPYTDTSYYNFQSTSAWYYLNVLSLIDSIALIDTTAIIGFLRSFEAWYDVYRFGQAVNTNYTIVSRDTTISIDTLTLPLRLSATGRRLNDQNVTTVNGTFLAKKFLLTYALSYLLELPPPFPPLVIPIITRPDTTYIVSDRWIVRDVMPSSNVDLNSIGFPIAFSIPGVIKELTNPPVGIISSSNEVPGDFSLSQNYPNPFNPSTRIDYQLPDRGQVSIKVFDILGNEVGTLVDEEQNAGSYSVQFNIGKNLSSGIYYYRLTVYTGNNGDVEFTDVKKMTLVK